MFDLRIQTSESSLINICFEFIFQGNTWITPLILIIAKSVAMPIIAREVVNLLNVGANATDTQEWSNFGFLYGTFPSAPGVFVYASKYDLETDMIASGMVACTFISAPIM